MVVNYASSKQDADRVVDQISNRGGNAVAVQGSVAKKADVERLFAEAEKTFGKIDIVVNNAGVYEFVPRRKTSPSSNSTECLIQTFSECFSPLRRRSSISPPRAGASSISARSPASLTPPTAVVYNATKGAVDAITRTLAKELGPRKIRVNSIRPGMVITEGVVTGGFHESDLRTMLESLTPLGRVGQTDDIAPAAVFFASDDSKWITGETLLIAGGLR